MKHYINAIKKYSDFEGRANNEEYWFFVMFNIMFSAILVIIEQLTGLYNSRTYIGYLSFFYSMFTLLPGLAVTVRRLHDTGRSWKYILLGLIPLVGPIWLIVLLASRSEEGANRYDESKDPCEAIDYYTSEVTAESSGNNLKIQKIKKSEKLADVLLVVSLLLINSSSLLNILFSKLIECDEKTITIIFKLSTILIYCSILSLIQVICINFINIKTRKNKKSSFFLKFII